MDTDSRPHRSSNTTTTTTNSNNNSNSSTSELFICFTSRLSSSSMKISSKSILSPGRTREPSQISLSSSLSRRLRSNGSMKGGQASPMFPTNGKKKGCAFENPEPSSPKVTCIGQVRVKTKKQGKKLRARSKRRGEVSFRKVEQQNNTTNTSSNNNNIEVSNYQFQQQECLPHRNQRWVHLPMTICEALRTFGAEFNCFLPCKSSCMASEREKEEKAAGSSGNGSSCGAVFARWLVAVQEGEEKEGREIELVVGEEDREENVMRSSQRRHVFEGIDIGEFEEGKCEETSEIVEQEEGRVSICIPPKNALLLMRCRSDPVKMAALANRFWECPVPQDEDCKGEDEEEEKGNEGEDLERKVEELDMGHVIEEEICQNGEEEQEEKIPLVQVLVVEEENEQESPRNELENVHEVQETELEKQEEEDEDKEEANEVEEIVVSGSLHEDVVDHEENEDFHQQHEPIHEEEEEDQEVVDDNNLDDMIASFSTSSVESEVEEQKEEQEQEESEAVAEESTTTTTTTGEQESTETTHEGSEPENPITHEPEPGIKSMEREESQQQKVERETSVLPDCLLLMMCEPKLSMEVSKETWVCSTDFIRWLPERAPPPQPPRKQQQQQQQQQQVVNKKDGPDEVKKRLSIDSNPAQCLQFQPPRSSCSFPAAPPMIAAHGAGGAASMATMIEQKLVGSKAYEPFVLTRCKSEPMRSAAKLAPEACFWKNRKLEPHRPATLGVGAAGVGC